MFLLFGLITIAVGITVMFLLPDNPMKSRLTQDEKTWAIERLRENQAGIENKFFKPYMVKECLLDLQTWLISLITITSNVTNAAVWIQLQADRTSLNSWRCRIRRGHLLGTYSAARLNQRGLNIIALLIPGIIGGCLMAFLPTENKNGKLIGIFMTNCVGASLPLLYSLATANYAGRTKKVFMNAVLLMSFCLGNIIGPETFQAKDTPDYIPAKIAIVVTLYIAACLTMFLRLYYIRENKRRDGVMVAEEKPHLVDNEFMDLTDRENHEFGLPKGDVLIHAGDLSNQGSLSELRKTVEWLEKADFEAKIVVAGNHDITLDADFYSQHGAYFHNQQPQNPVDCINLFETSSSITYLNHETTKIQLEKQDGPQTTFKIFGSPYSPSKGLWAFGYSTDEASGLWDQIPLDSDIVITHTPPKYHCDESRIRQAAGCEVLRQTLWRVRPRLAVCGHIHEARGTEIVHWDLGCSNIKYKEDRKVQWDDPGRDNKKQSLVDLTTRNGYGVGLDNDGSIGSWGYTNDDKLSISTGNHNAELEIGARQPSLDLYFSSADTSSSMDSPNIANDFIGRSIATLPERAGAPSLSLDPRRHSPATRGQGGQPPSGRCDLEALSGRMGRRETCIVNAAIMSSSWPHKDAGGKKFNKPVVVDLELPVWTENE
ncbi:MAG: hypothetical protein M1827_004841 [Pycnora praestabilis]|nr:MAG: hypothetical protein M1827_004841 [Pycnora praestabilis]